MALLGVAILVDLAVLFAVPCPHFYEAVVPSTTQEQLSVPSGEHVIVTVRWYQPQGATATVFLQSGKSLHTSTTVLNESGSQGTLTFTTGSGLWWLFVGSGSPIYYVVSYNSPLL